MLLEKNVKFHMNDNVTEVRGAEGKVKWKITHLVDLFYQILTWASVNTKWHFVSVLPVFFLPQGEGGLA